MSNNLKRNPDKIREWKKRSIERQYQHKREMQAKLGPKPKQKPRKVLRAVSEKRQREMNDYYKVRAAWLKLPANSACVICLCLNESASPALEVHHLRGRIGRLLCDTRFFVASCRGHRDWPHENPAQARELGLLCDPGEWNVYPGDPEPETIFQSK